MTTTSERSYSVEPGTRPGTEDNSAAARLTREAERDHHERIAAVRAVAGLARDAREAREFCAMLGLSDDEVREARRQVVAVPAAGSAPSGSRRRGKVAAA